MKYKNSEKRVYVIVRAPFRRIKLFLSHSTVWASHSSVWWEIQKQKNCATLPRWWTWTRPTALRRRFKWTSQGICLVSVYKNWINQTCALECPFFQDFLANNYGSLTRYLPYPGMARSPVESFWPMMNGLVMSRRLNIRALRERARESRRVGMTRRTRPNRAERHETKRIKANRNE
jgi:hypothetical protein